MPGFAVFGVDHARISGPDDIDRHTLSRRTTCSDPRGQLPKDSNVLEFGNGILI
jgi:hypothetical protein